MAKFGYNKKLRKRVFFFATTLFLILVIAISNNNKSYMSIGENAIGTVMTPINKVFYVIGSKVTESFHYVFGTRQMREDNKKLVLENAKLKKNIDNLSKVIGDKRYLQEEYELLNKDRTIKSKAFITGKDPGNIFTRFSIDKGSLDKIKKGDIVVQAVSSNDGIEKGLVGIVTEVGLNHSKVDTLMDSGNNVGFRLAKSEDVGVLNDRENGVLKGYMYDANADVKVGDVLMTSGLGGVYPRDIKIGEVIEVSKSKDNFTKNIKCKSQINFNNMYRVLIVDGQGVN
ncbi:rod shape-determining protein MreC [uncultured Finegoldia sp.]|uniref:rod shape-determining protein MreC n=1 Tax=uncultured Finegoldia sp. TaxID=328009 RepID=UPI00261BF183|nr:rod shape-determining protein MreC [uncultured Finegoldia sp.]